MAGIISDNVGRSSGLIKAAGGGGKIGQVLFATDNTTRSTNSGTLNTASNTLTVDITPSATSSKVMLLCTFGGIMQDSANEGHYTFFRDSTNLASDAGVDDCFIVNTLGSSTKISASMSHVDSPNSTSALTYQVYMSVGSNSHTAYINPASATNSQSTLIVMEVLA